MKIAFKRAGLALLISLSPTCFAQAQTITISNSLPGDIAGGAPAATLQQSAEFAWQEFIALNWPALAGQRDVPDPAQKFGAGNGPLVWQTYRSKVEIFNLTKNAQGIFAPPGYSTTAPNFGYNSPPVYVYGPPQGAKPVRACTGQVAPATPAWINLDETTQIGFAQMFAGGPAVKMTNSSVPQLIRYAVKANAVEYGYVAKNQYFQPGKATMAFANGVSAFTANPPRVPTAPFISFMPGTIEIKSAWRPLTTADDPTHFHVQTVRFYENKGGTCYYEEQWGLVALHIIQKTPSAPAFIYATFEQGENIKQPNGTAVENLNGKVTDPIKPSAGPTTPALTYADSKDTPKVTAKGGACTPDNSLYFRDNPADKGLTGGIAVCVNQRYESIPDDVVGVNKAAHDAIAAYNSANNVQNSPWPYYKLVSVQAAPFDVSAISMTDPTHLAAVFYQANIVVETNYLLQQFKGRIAGDGAPTSYPPSSAAAPPPNVVTVTGNTASGVNMGGCMGCHGNAQVAKGSDFSFILAEGITRFPETPSAFGLAAVRAKYRNLFPR